MDKNEVGRVEGWMDMPRHRETMKSPFSSCVTSEHLVQNSTRGLLGLFGGDYVMLLQDSERPGRYSILLGINLFIY